MKRKYEWRDTRHGPQLWDTQNDCWAIWYGIGAIGVSDEVKKEIDEALNDGGKLMATRQLCPTIAALCGQVNRYREWLDKIDELLQNEFGGMYESAPEGSALAEARRMPRRGGTRGGRP